MSSQYFGFDDDATVSTSCIQKPSPCPSKIAPKKVISETEQLSISQIQALLCQDLTTLDGTTSTNLSTNETSFYTDEQDVTTVTLAETVTDDFQEDVMSIHEEKVERRSRKVLGEIENKTEGKSCKTYKKPTKTVSHNVRKPQEENSFQKQKQIVKPAIKRKTKKENIENENFDKFAEVINKKFAEVENFQLQVE